MSSSNHLHHFTLLLLLLFVFLLLSFSAATTTDFVFTACSPSKYTPNSPYNLDVNSLLSSLLTSSSSSTYSNSTSTTSSSSSPAFGFFQCHNDLSPSECSTCINTAISQLTTLCPLCTGATVQLNGCLIRYDNNSDFIGTPDTTLLAKKCGAASNYAYSASFMGMRDAALAGLVNGMQNYRVGGAGYVQAMAQCVGDLSSKDCDDCVAVAVAQLKSSCGFAVGGDVYLAKCYAKFWSAGVYPSAPHDDDYDSDETGKTVAIIIGVIAGIALLVIFLSLLSRYGSGKS